MFNVVKLCRILISRRVFRLLQSPQGSLQKKSEIAEESKILQEIFHFLPLKLVRNKLWWIFAENFTLHSLPSWKIPSLPSYIGLEKPYEKPKIAKISEAAHDVRQYSPCIGNLENISLKMFHSGIFQHPVHHPSESTVGQIFLAYVNLIAQGCPIAVTSVESGVKGSNSVVPFTKKPNYLSMLPNFLSQFPFLPGEPRTFPTENFVVFSADLMRKSEIFLKEVAHVYFSEKLDCSSEFCNVGMQLRPFVRRRIQGIHRRKKDEFWKVRLLVVVVDK